MASSVYKSAVRPEIFLTRRVPDLVRVELERLFELRRHDSERPPTRATLLDRAAGMDGLVTTATDRVDGELFEAAGPQLRVVANYAVGVDNIDLEEARRRGVVIANTPGVLTAATAELTIALVLALSRRVAEGDRLIRRGDPWILAPTFMLATGLEGRTLGIVGLGRIGAEVARLAAGLGMNVVYSSRGPKDGVKWSFLPLAELLAEAHVVSLHCPLTPETHHLIGAPELGAMRREGLLVNVARGPIVDEEALVDALKGGEIAGAAVDVFEHEPEVHPGLLGLENVVLVPHLGSATYEAREGMGMLCVEALRAVLLEGRLPPNAVTVE
jgi:glyoxylate reductase